MKTKRTCIAVFLVLCLAGVGCGQNTVITDLETALSVISGAFPIIAGLTGVPPATVTAVENYLDATNSALGQASTILAGPGTDGQKAAQIVAAFAGIAVPVVPPQYAALAALVQSLAKDVASFLASLPASSSTGTTVLTTDNRTHLSTAQTSVSNNRAAIGQLRRH